MRCACCVTGKKFFVSIPVRFAPVPHSNDVNQCPHVIERVHYAVVTDADTPEIVAALEFLAPGRSRLGRKRFNLWENSLD